MAVHDTDTAEQAVADRKAANDRPDKQVEYFVVRIAAVDIAVVGIEVGHIVTPPGRKEHSSSDR